MNSRIKGYLVISLLLLMLLSPGIIKRWSCNGKDPPNLLHKEGFGASSRKLLQVDTLMDYGDAGPNPKHDPRGRKGGSGKTP